MSDAQEPLESLQRSLTTTNSEIESKFQEIECHHADLVGRQGYLRSMLAAYRVREQELAAYTAELSRKRDLLASMRQDVTHRLDGIRASLDGEIAVARHTLFTLTQELSLFIERRKTTTHSATSLARRIKRLREEKAKLDEQKKGLDLQIGAFASATPRPSPKKLTQELSLIRQELGSITAESSARERQIIGHELAIVMLQSQHSAVTEHLARLAGESGAHDVRVSAAFRGLQAEIAASTERSYGSQAKQLEQNARAVRL
jgi:chromosome segregation ATPase